MARRSAGSRWRLLVHTRTEAHHVQSHPDRRDPPLPNTTVINDAEFDELVVGRWLHVEQMNTNGWWINVGGVTLWVDADREGRPRRVGVYGPGDWADPVEGVAYECSWSTPTHRGDETVSEGDEVPEEYTTFSGCTCEHDSEQHGWTECDVDGCECEGHWEE